MKKQETFASLLKSFEYRYDIHRVFDDFLTLIMCAVTQNPLTKKSHYEDLYLSTIAPYKDDQLRFQFPKLFAQLINEMEYRVSSSEGNDVLGDYYQEHLYKKGTSQYFTPWPVCVMMAKATLENADRNIERPLRILDPCCGSGRMLNASATVAGKQHHFYGIDIDHECVNMTALNLFLNGIFHAEIMCANTFIPEDFRISYVTSLLPFGIFRIEEKEKSLLWQIHNQEKEPLYQPPQFNKKNSSDGNESQLTLF